MRQDVKDAERPRTEGPPPPRINRNPFMTFTGVNLREGLTFFKSLGGTVEAKRKTGELRLRHPNLPKAVVVNSRRKDSPRAMTVALRKLSVA